jgi:hypothetical protein
MDNSNLREDQKKALREVLMLVTSVRGALEAEGTSVVDELLKQALSKLHELNRP